MFIARLGTPACAAVLALLLGACSSMASRPVMPISEVVTLGKSQPPERVMDRISRSKTTYALRGSDFGKLDDAGVQPKLLDFLQQIFLNDVDLLTRYWVTGESLGGCVPCYPQPVDLATLASGGNGMADNRDVAIKNPGIPQGLPAWVTAYPGKVFGPALTTSQIEQMVKDGTPQAEIVERIRASRFHDIIAAGVTKVSTHYVAGLSGSELARLHKDGASDEVLDTFQQKFLAEYIEFSRIRYQSLGKGPAMN